MIWTILPWIVSAITLTTMWMAGNKSPKAWLLGLFNQILWAAIISHSELWGLLPTTLGMCFIYIRNFYKWHKDATI